MTEEAQDKSIIREKYRDKYSADNRDWLGEFIDGQCTEAQTKIKQVPVMDSNNEVVKDEDGKPVTEEKEVTLKKRRLNLDSLFDLAEANAIGARAKYGDQADRKNAPGRLRMTIGNMLRAAAKRRHGLYTIDGEWTDAPSEFIGDAELKENKDGTKIAKAVPEAEADEADAA